MRFTKFLSGFPFPFVLSVLMLIPAGALAGLPATRADAVGGTRASSSPAVQEFLDSFSGGTIPLEEYSGEVREFTLEIHAIEREIAPGVPVEQWAFGLAGEEPTVPGPELRVSQGDLVRISLVNGHDQPHSLHLHGITSVSQQMDGVPHTSHQLLPGESYTYEFVAMKPGTHAYHCHVQTYLHMDMGMYGVLIVEPREEERVWDSEHTLILDEWDSGQDPASPVHAPKNDHYLINGKAFPDVEPIRIENGEIARIRLINMGYEPHSMHLHGMSFLVVAKDGHELTQPYEGDTLPILPGERYDILVKGRDGDFPFHDHIVGSVTNAGSYPGGMHLMVEGGHSAGTTDDVPGDHAHSEAAAGHDHADPAHHGASSHAPLAEDDRLLEGEVNVEIEEFAFAAPVLRVEAGTTVTWTNRDAAPHTVTEGSPGREPAFGSDMLAQGESWSMTFSEAGEYEYYCLPHPFMTARVIVE